MTDTPPAVSVSVGGGGTDPVQAAFGRVMRVKAKPGEPKAKPSALGDPLSVDDVLARAGDKVPCLVDGYIPENAVVMLSGTSGVGKSYLLSHMIACGERGHQFLTHPCQQFESLWFTEEPMAFLAQKIRRFGIQSTAFYGRDHLDVRASWAELVQEGVDRARKMGKRLLIFDPFPTWARHEGDAEQSSGAMTQALAPCLAAAKGGLTVLLTHHDTRAGSPYRGSGAIKGALDIGLWLRLLDSSKSDGPRVLSLEKDRPAFQTPQRTVTLDEGGYKVLGDPMSAKAEQYQEAARDALRAAGEDGMSATALAQAIGVRKDIGLRVARMVGVQSGKGNTVRWHARPV